MQSLVIHAVDILLVVVAEARAGVPLVFTDQATDERRNCTCLILRRLASLASLQALPGWRSGSAVKARRLWHGLVVFQVVAHTAKQAIP